jgi:hypothetical protein
LALSSILVPMIRMFGHLYAAIYFVDEPPFPWPPFRERVLDETTTPTCLSGAAPLFFSRRPVRERVLNAKTVPASLASCRPLLSRFRPCRSRALHSPAGRGTHGLKRGNTARHNAGQAGTVFASRTRSLDSEGLAWFCAGDADRRCCVVKHPLTERRPGKGGPSAKYTAVYTATMVSDHSICVDQQCMRHIFYFVIPFALRFSKCR